MLDKQFQIVIFYFIFKIKGSIKVDTSTCLDLLTAADMFGIQEAVDICSQFLLEHIDSQNCVGKKNVNLLIFVKFNLQSSV